MLIAGALVFNYVVTIENIPLSVQAFIAGFHLTPIGFLLLVNAVLLVLGCLLEGTTILLVIVPILIPTAKALGVDLVHFGVVVVVNIMIGLLTPPFGLLLFVVANMTRQPLMGIVREAMPFIADGDRRVGASSPSFPKPSCGCRADGLQALRPQRRRNVETT